MRLIVVVLEQLAKRWLKITLGGSELTGPAFTQDGGRLYFNSQRGHNLPLFDSGCWLTCELTIPPQFRNAA